MHHHLIAFPLFHCLIPPSQPPKHILHPDPTPGVLGLSRHLDNDRSPFMFLTLCRCPADRHSINAHVHLFLFLFSLVQAFTGSRDNVLYLSFHLACREGHVHYVCHHRQWLSLLASFSDHNLMCLLSHTSPLLRALFSTQLNSYSPIPLPVKESLVQSL